MTKHNYTFGDPIEFPNAEPWRPRKGETRVFQLMRVIHGEFGESRIAKDLESDEEWFLPNHVMLDRRLVRVPMGSIVQIRCIEEGSKTAGDYYNYEVRVAIHQSDGDAPSPF